MPQYIDNNGLVYILETLKSEGAETLANAKEYTESVVANYVLTENLEAAVANLGYLTASKADIRYATIDRADIIEASVEQISGDFLAFKTGEFEVLKADQASFETATAEHFTAVQAQIDSLDVGNLDAKYATIENLNAANATIVTLTGDLADYKKITTENLSAATGKIDILTGNLADYKKLIAEELLVAKGWIAEGSIGSAQISDLNANKIRSGTLDTSLVRVAGSDGNLQISDNTLQISDATRVRVQVGKDASGDYTLAVWDKNGKLIWDALGATENTIQRKIIRDNVVAEDANIQGSKLDVNSVVREINGATEKISSTIVNVGDKSLIVFLEEQDNTITEQGKTLTSQAAQIKANQDSISLTVKNQDFNSYKTVVTGEIATAKAGAISTAATDATTKANNAKSAAVSAAAEDAKTKADKALADSKSYTNGQVTTVNEHLSTIDASITVLQERITLKVEQTDIDTAITTVDKKFASYSTTTQMNSAIELSKTGILSTVSSTYSTKTETNAAKTAADNAAKSASTANTAALAAQSTANTAQTTAAQTADKFKWIVKSGTSATDFTLTDRVASLLASKFNVDALTTFKNSIENGTSTVINGGAIKTGTIKADRIDINDIFSKNITATGTITGAKLVGATGSFSGSVTAAAGTIGPWNIGDASIWKGNNTFGNASGMYFGDAGFSITDKFKVTNMGAVTGTNVSLNGTFKSGGDDYEVVIKNGQISLSDRTYVSVINGRYFSLGGDDSSIWNDYNSKSIMAEANIFSLLGAFNCTGNVTCNDVIANGCAYVGQLRFKGNSSGNYISIGNYNNAWNNYYYAPGYHAFYCGGNGIAYIQSDGIHVNNYDIQFNIGHGIKYGGSEWILRPYKSGDYNVTALGNGDRRTVLYGTQVRLNGANGTTVSSDRRLKKDFEEFDERHEKFFMALTPITYRMAYTKNPEEYKRTNGFIAQDVEKALVNADLNPEELDLISYDTADQEYLNEMFNGHPPDIQKQYSLNYSGFIALNTYMIQKIRKEMIYQAGKIDLHETIIRDLQNRIYQLEKQLKELKQAVA